MLLTITNGISFLLPAGIIIAIGKFMPKESKEGKQEKQR